MTSQHTCSIHRIADVPSAHRAQSLCVYGASQGYQKSYLSPEMQNRFASELSLQQALRDLTNVVPGSLYLDWRLQLLSGYHVREPDQIFRSRTTIEFCIHPQPVESRSPSTD
jgi:hypothetical protein